MGFQCPTPVSPRETQVNKLIKSLLRALRRDYELLTHHCREAGTQILQKTRSFLAICAAQQLPDKLNELAGAFYLHTGKVPLRDHSS